MLARFGGGGHYAWVILEAAVVAAILAGLMQVATRIVLGQAVDFVDAIKVTFAAAIATRLLMMFGGGDPFAEPAAMTGIGVAMAAVLGLIGFAIVFDMSVADTAKATLIFVILTAVVEFAARVVTSYTGTWA